MLQSGDPRNRDLIVNIGGRLVHRDKAGVSPFDSVVQGGDAVWEGLRLYDGRIFKLIEHLDRLRASAKALGFEIFGCGHDGDNTGDASDPDPRASAGLRTPSPIPSREEIVAEIRRTLHANKMRDGVHIRLTLTRGEKITSGMDPRLNQSGPTLIVLAEFKSPVYSKEGLSFVTSSVRRSAPDFLDPKIHHNNLLPSILAKMEANVAGADSALMLDAHGFVAEAHASHVFFVGRSGAGCASSGSADGSASGDVGGEGAGAAPVHVFTPTTDACPEGITRETVLKLCWENGILAVVRNISLTEAYNADEMFCTGTMGEIAGVTRLDGRVIGNGEVGPVTRRIAGWYSEETASTGYPILD